jgi:hypothetical protein
MRNRYVGGFAVALLSLSLLVWGCGGSTKNGLPDGGSFNTGDAGTPQGYQLWFSSGTPSATALSFVSADGSSAPNVFDQPGSTDPWVADMTPTTFSATKGVSDATGTASFTMAIQDDVLTFTLQATSQAGGLENATSQAGVLDINLCYRITGAHSITFKFDCSGSGSVGGDFSSLDINVSDGSGGSTTHCQYIGQNDNGPAYPPTWVQNTDSVTLTADSTGQACFSPDADFLEMYVRANAGSQGVGGNSTVSGTIKITATSH